MKRLLENIRENATEREMFDYFGLFEYGQEPPSHTLDSAALTDPTFSFLSPC